MEEDLTQGGLEVYHIDWSISISKPVVASALEDDMRLRMD
jgi:hypothetical protein